MFDYIFKNILFSSVTFATSLTEKNNVFKVRVLYVHAQDNHILCIAGTVYQVQLQISVHMYNSLFEVYQLYQMMYCRL